MRNAEDLEVGMMVVFWLRDQHIRYVGELVRRTEGELMRSPTMNRRMFSQIKEALAECGLHLGMEVPYWPTERLAAIVLKAGIFFERVDEMPLSVRSANCLKHANVDYVGQLVQKTDEELLRTPNFGRSSLNEIREMLSGMGLPLGTDLSDWSGSTDTLPDAGL